MLLFVFLLAELGVCVCPLHIFFFNIGTLEEKFQVSCSFYKAACDLSHQVHQFKSFMCVPVLRQLKKKL